eukprot:SAG25_NODE_1963_length_2088_cov_1.531658_3_plen_62_part_00
MVISNPWHIMKIKENQQREQNYRQEFLSSKVSLLGSASCSQMQDLAKYMTRRWLLPGVRAD